MKLRAILVVLFSLGLWLTAVGQELTVRVPPGEYEFWLEWMEDGKGKEGKHTKATGDGLKANLAELTAGAQERKILILNSKTDLLAEQEVGEGGSLTLTEADFHLIPELKVTVRVPEQEAHLLAEVALEQVGAHRSAQVEISEGEGTATFDRVEAFGTAEVRVKAPGYAEYEVPVALVGPDKKGVSVVEVGLARLPVVPPVRPLEALAERRGWDVFFWVVLAVAGLTSLVFIGISLVTGDSALPTLSRQWLVSLWGLPMVGVVGWWVCAMLVLFTPQKGLRLVFLPGLVLAYMLVSLAMAWTGRRFLSAAGLVAVATSASLGLSSLPVSSGGLFWATFVFAALTLVSSLVGGLMVAFAGSVAAMPQARTVEAGICPYCGQRRHPVTGACACQPGRPREAGGARLVVEAGERVGETFSIGERFTIGREPGNDLVVSDMTVSRRHCVIVGEGRGVIIRDEGSANGTLVNGERITERSLSAGDRIQVGSVVIRFEGAEGTGA